MGHGEQSTTSTSFCICLRLQGLSDWAAKQVKRQGSHAELQCLPTSVLYTTSCGVHADETYLLSWLVAGASVVVRCNVVSC